jgi:hypothetical protein
MAGAVEKTLLCGFSPAKSLTWVKFGRNDTDYYRFWPRLSWVAGDNLANN